MWVEEGSICVKELQEEPVDGVVVDVWVGVKEVESEVDGGGLLAVARISSASGALGRRCAHCLIPSLNRLFLRLVFVSP